MQCKHFKSCGYEFCVPELCNDYEIAPPTNADRIRSMNDDQLRDFLEDVANNGIEAIWSKEFSTKFCDSCPTITAKLEGYDREMAPITLTSILQWTVTRLLVRFLPR